jgi:hypothetical protein
MSPNPPLPERFGCEQVLDRLEAFLDGDLPAAEQALARAHVEGPAACARCTRELALARSILQTMRELPAETCPPGVVDRARAHAETRGTHDRDPADGAPPAAPLGLPANDDAPGPARGWWLTAAVAAAALLVVFGLLVLSSLLRDPAAPATVAVAGDAGGPDAEPTAPDGAAIATPGSGTAGIDPAELARATVEARLALAYVASVGRRSALLLRDDVVGDNIIGPSARALQRAMEPLRPRAPATPPGADPGDQR